MGKKQPDGGWEGPQVAGVAAKRGVNRHQMAGRLTGNSRAVGSYDLLLALGKDQNLA